MDGIISKELNKKKIKRKKSLTNSSLKNDYTDFLKKNKKKKVNPKK